MFFSKPYTLSVRVSYFFYKLVAWKLSKCERKDKGLNNLSPILCVSIANNVIMLKYPN
jgi:hypothetical protein